MQELLARQDCGARLSAAERREAEGLVDLALFLTEESGNHSWDVLLDLAG